MSRKRNRTQRNVSPTTPQITAADTKAQEVQNQIAMDAYANPAAGLGWGAENLTEGTEYPLTRLTQNYMLMLSLYRSSGILRRIVNKPVEDAISHWFKIDSQITPDQVDSLERLERRTRIKVNLEKGLKWGRLFGGAAGLIMIDGQGNILDQPLDLDTVEPDSFKGIYIVDRWSGLYPDPHLVDDIGSPAFGLPEFYHIRTSEDATSDVKVHYSRILRFSGDELPYWEKQVEQMWGTSVVETVYDSLKRYDTVLGNIAQLIWQANIWTHKMEGANNLFGTGARQMQSNVINSIHAQRALMDSFGERILDTSDDLQNHQYNFSGLDRVFSVFQYDMSSVTGIPITILFGRSAAGLDATGDADLDNYYTMVEEIQENRIRPLLEQLLPIMCMSEFGAVPDDIELSFNPVRVPTEKEKSEIGTAKTTAIVQAHTEGIINDQIALKELRSMADGTGLFSNITDEDIESADNVPDVGDVPGDEETEPGDTQTGEQSDSFAADSRIKNPVPIAKNADAIKSEIEKQLSQKGIDIETAQTNTPVEIPISNIKTVQDYVTTEKLNGLRDWNASKATNGNFPKVVRLDNQNYLMDGNHRTAAAILRGDKTIPAWFYDLDKAANDDKPSIDEIQTAAEKYKPDYNMIAVRTQDVPFELGRIKHKSERWSDGEPTGQKLDGLSCTSVRSSAIRKHTPEFDPREGQYQGDYVALIGGNHYHTGHDKGEVVIRDPEVLEILRPKGKTDNE